MLDCQPDNPTVALIYSNLGTIGFVFGGGAVIAHIIYYWARGFVLTLPAIIAKFLAAESVPAAVGLIGAVLAPAKLLGCIKNLELYIIVGGIAVLWITITILFPQSIERKRKN
jgi:hypothetical protein